MANYTPQQIEGFLREFFDVVGTRQYVGARYVPLFGRKGEPSIEWDDTAPYEPLTIVTNEGNSYTSRTFVPEGVDISNEDYWALTGAYNAQVEAYRQEVATLGGRVEANTAAINAEQANRARAINELGALLPAEDFDSDNTVKDYVGASNSALAVALRNVLVPFPDTEGDSKYGIEGQVLSTLANGKSRWVNPVTITSDVAGPIIEDWLDEHPDATTTVENFSVSNQKLSRGSEVFYLMGSDIPFGRTVEIPYSSLPVLADNAYFATSDNQLHFNAAVPSKVVMMPTKGVRAITITPTASQTSFTDFCVVMLRQDGTFYQKVLQSSTLSDPTHDYTVVLNTRNFDYNTYMVFNWIGTTPETQITNDRVTVEYMAREEWYGNNNLYSEIKPKYDVYLHALPTYLTGFYVNNFGVETANATSNVVCMIPDYIDEIEVTYPSGYAAYPNVSTPFAVLKDKNGVMLDKLGPTDAGTYTMAIDHETANGGMIYLNVFNDSSWYHEWLSTGGTMSIGFALSCKVTKHAEEMETRTFPFRDYVRRPFNFTDKAVEFIGDSITEGVTDTNPVVVTNNPWPTLFCDIAGVGTYTNRAIRGACYYEPSNPGPKSMLEQLQDVSGTPDYIFIAGGTNDYLFGTSTANFRTAVREVVTYIANNLATSNVIFITPPNEAGFEGPPAPETVASLETYRNIISEEVITYDSGKFSIIQGDTFNFPDRYGDTDYINTVFGDRLHPSEIGYRTVYVTNVLGHLC